MTPEKNIVNPGALFDKDKLKKELAEDIARKFGIDKNKAEILIKKDTLTNLDSLKDELNISEKEENSLDNKEIEKLFFTLKGALELIENASKIEIKTLREDVEKSLNIDEFKNKIEDYLPAKLLEKAKNPQNLHEHILGLTLGTTNSIIATADALYQIGKGIIKAPYDIYLVVTGKAKIKNFKDI